MKVVENRVIDFRRGDDSIGGRSVHLIYGTPEPEGRAEHDARGLVIALLLCLGCWAALGYFLLT